MHQLEEIIGYRFKDENLLLTALTHTSYANESREPIHHNERLEFLGDSILSFVTAEYLYTEWDNRPEGELTRARASLVCEEALFGFAKTIDLGSFLRLGHGEELGGGRYRPSVVSDAFEALIAAMYLDGGIEPAKKFILGFLNEGKSADKDYKTEFQEKAQQDKEAKISYEIIEESGPDHNKHFVAAVYLNGTEMGRGEGHSKKYAEQRAAQAALKNIG